MAVRPPEINGSDIRSQEHSLYTIINGGPQTAVPYIYVRYQSWFPCGSQWHGQEVQKPRESAIGEPPTIIGDVTDIITRIHKTAVCQKNGIQSKRTRNKFQNSVRSGKPQFMGPWAPWGLQWPYLCHWGRWYSFRKYVIFTTNER
jgi:hypothetical protein